MVGVFFLCKNQSMDVVKLCDILLEEDELKDIPLTYILRVAIEVICVISSGECFYKNEFD